MPQCSLCVITLCSPADKDREDGDGTFFWTVGDGIRRYKSAYHTTKKLQVRIWGNNPCSNVNNYILGVSILWTKNYWNRYFEKEIAREIWAQLQFSTVFAYDETEFTSRQAFQLSYSVRILINFNFYENISVNFSDITVIFAPGFRNMTLRIFCFRSWEITQLFKKKTAFCVKCSVSGSQQPVTGSCSEAHKSIPHSHPF
jgi:hypothetical protein